MGNQVWSSPVQPMAPGAGTAVTGGTTLTAATPPPPPFIPAGWLQSGSEIVVVADLEQTSTSATPTCTLSMAIGAVGGLIGSAALWPSNAVTMAIATGAPIKFRWRGTVRTLSATAGVIQGTGELLYPTSLTAWSPSPVPPTLAGRTISTINTSQALQLDVGVTLSSTTGTPSVTCTGFYAEVLG